MSHPQRGLWRYPESLNSGQTAFSLNPGHHPVSDLSTTLEPFDLAGAQGLRLQIGFAGADVADNDTVNYKVWGCRYTYARNSNGGDSPTGFHAALHSFGIATASAAKFIAGATAAATGRMADTLTHNLAAEGSGTYRGIGTKLETAFGSPGTQVYNHPTADTEAAELLIQHLGWADFVIVEFDLDTGAPDGAFALLQRC